MRLATLLALLLVTYGASAQECAHNTGNNASVFLMKDAYRSLNPGDKVRVYANDLCVGETVLESGDALAYAVTAWGDDEITEEVDGAVSGSLLQLAIEKPATTAQIDVEGAFADNLEYAPDRLYRIISAEFDTTTTRLMDSLNAQIEVIGAELDTAYAIADFLSAELAQSNTDRDSLQNVVYAQHANITDLQAQLATANATIDSLQAVINDFPDVSQLEADLAAAQAQVAALELQVGQLEMEVANLNTQLVLALDKLRQIEYVANGNKGRYREILDILNQP